MKTIHKYALPGAITHLSTHEGARFLHVDVQGTAIVAWAEVDPNAATVIVPVELVPTGSGVPRNHDHLGTVLLDDGHLVLHVYVGNAR